MRSIGKYIFGELTPQPPLLTREGALRSKSGELRTAFLYNSHAL